MDPIVWENETPQLRNPVLVATFSGWNDAASAASAALGAVADSLETELIAQIDPEEFFDFQATRPQIELTEGRLRGVAWPENLIVAGRSHEAERDLLMISGTEPSTRWRTFCNSVLDVAERCGVESMVTFGALIADVAHTRPVPITGLATTDELIDRLGFEDVAYEGPTGIVGVLHGIAKERGFTAASLWAAVPHYAAAVPNPKAALALLRRLEGLTGIPLDGCRARGCGELLRGAGQPGRRRQPRDQGDGRAARVPAGRPLRPQPRRRPQRRRDRPRVPGLPPPPGRVGGRCGAGGLAGGSRHGSSARGRRRRPLGHSGRARWAARRRRRGSAGGAGPSGEASRLGSEGGELAAAGWLRQWTNHRIAANVTSRRPLA